MDVDLGDGDELAIGDVSDDPGDVTVGAEYHDAGGTSVGVGWPTPYTPLYDDDGLMNGVSVGVGDAAVSWSADDDWSGWDTVADVDNQIEDAATGVVDTASEAATAVADFWSGGADSEVLTSPGIVDDGTDDDTDTGSVWGTTSSDTDTDTGSVWGDTTTDTDTGSVWGDTSTDTDTGSVWGTTDADVDEPGL